MELSKFIGYVVILLFGGWLAVSVFDYAKCEEKEERIQQKDSRIAELTDLLYRSRRVNKLSLVLEQVITPLQVHELEALNEKLKQEKRRGAEKK